MRRYALALLLSAASVAPATAQTRTQAPQGAEVYFVTPEDGQTVEGPITVRFGLKGMGVAPAGVQTPNTGHHHLIIDADTPAADRPVPSDATHKHFGGGQTETVVTLPPGRHTLQLVVGDFAHIPHEPPVVSKRISITVK